MISALRDHGAFRVARRSDVVVSSDITRAITLFCEAGGGSVLTVVVGNHPD